MGEMFSIRPLSCGSPAFKFFAVPVVLGALLALPIQVHAQNQEVSGTYQTRVSEILDEVTRSDRELVNRWIGEAKEHLAKAREHVRTWKSYRETAASARGKAAASARMAAREELEQAIIEYSAAAVSASNGAGVYSKINIGKASVALDRVREGIFHLKDASKHAGLSREGAGTLDSPVSAAVRSAENALGTAEHTVKLAIDIMGMDYASLFGARYASGPDSAYARISRIADGLEAEGSDGLDATHRPYGRDIAQSEFNARPSPIFIPTTAVYGPPTPYGGSVVAQLLAFPETPIAPDLAEFLGRQAAPPRPLARETQALRDVQPFLSEIVQFSAENSANLFSQTQREEHLDFLDRILQILRYFYELVF